MKHIESIQPEYAAADLSRLLVSEPDATASAALTALLHNVTGCAIPPTADTPQSEVEELVPLCLSILRRHWTTPLTALGDGTTPMSLADLMRRLILGRVDGNEALGIPPANADIPTAVAALRDRKIGGLPEAPDGISLVHLLCSDERLAITKLQDDNYGYENNRPIDLTPFPNVNELTIGAERIDYGTPKSILTSQSVKTLHIAAKYARATFNIPADGTLDAPNLEEFFVGHGGGPNCKIIYMPKFRKPNGIDIFRWWQTDSPLNVEIMILGSVVSGSITNWLSGTADRLIHFEFGADGLGGLSISLNISWWTATNCLDASRTDLIEEGSTAQNNLQQFLSNFKTYIAERLTDKCSGLTLTLSQAVRDAIQTDPDIVNIITSKGWTISPAPSV